MQSGKVYGKLKKRHSRSIPLIGLEGHRRLADSTVVIAGLGAIGSVVAEILVRQGIGLLVFIDSDRAVEPHNLDRQFMYREKHIGEPKAVALKESAGEINGDVEVIAYVGTFSQAIRGSLKGVIISADLLISATDNRLGRYSVARFAYMYDIPHLDGATGEYNCRAYIFPSSRKGPCFMCTMTRRDYEEISAIFSCTRSTNNETIAPAITETGVQVANILATEAIKLLLGRSPEYNEIRMNIFNWQIMAEEISATQSHAKGHPMG